jgi:hypothetical protein
MTVSDKPPRIEREIKFDPPADDEVVLRHLRQMLPENWRLERHFGLACDLYFDTEHLDLYRSGALVRLRRRGRKEGWSMFFKPAPTASVPYMEREEIRTKFSREEALLYKTTGFPGLAAARALDWLRKHGATTSTLAPTLLLHSTRRYYTVRPGTATDDWLSFINVFFDDVVAIDVREVDHYELVGWNTLRYERLLPERTFRVGEIETYERDSEELTSSSLKLAIDLSQAIRGAGIAFTSKCKYALAIESLGWMGAAKVTNAHE